LSAAGAGHTHFEARLLDPLAGTIEGPLDDVDARDLPAAFRETDAPHAAAGPDIERTAVWRAIALLLASDQFQELVGEWRVLGQVPRMEAERVQLS
jgi:hypothetical protein